MKYTAKRYVFSGGDIQPAVAGGTDAQIARIVQDMHTIRDALRELAGQEVVDHGHTVICATVVHKDQLKVMQCLSQYRGNAFFGILFHIVNRNNYRHFISGFYHTVLCHHALFPIFKT